LFGGLADSESLQATREGPGRRGVRGRRVGQLVMELYHGCGAGAASSVFSPLLTRVYSS
jgi:hypothetical protein